MKRLVGFVAAVFVAMVSADASAARCDANCLRAQLDAYVAALIKRAPNQVKIAPTARFTENGVVLKFGEGLWRKASGLGTYQHRMVDVVSQQAMFIGVVNEEGAPALVTVRLGLLDGHTTEVEHVVARKGSHALFAPDAFVKPHSALTTPIAPNKRLARDALLLIAASYFDGIEKHDSKIILAADTCQRVENGVQTTNQPGRTSRNCAHSADLLTYIRSVEDRRYPIVDVEHGVVVSTILFDIPGEKPGANSARISADPQVAARLQQPRTLLLTEWFKIEDGKTQHIEAIMHNLPHGSRSGWEP